MSDTTTPSNSRTSSVPPFRYSAHLASELEARWQDAWEQNGTFEAPNPAGPLGDPAKVAGREKLFILDMFPYPSGAGLHVGHPLGYIGTDVFARFKRMKGFNVLHALGYDSFGLPAEQYAIQTGQHPAITTEQNISRYEEQLRKIGFSFDWSREVRTSNPDYYKHTQWIFIQLFKKGLAFRDTTYVNYCPSCKVVLSNEDSQGGKCDRCDTPVVQKEKDVWFLKITEYAEKLLEGLTDLETLPRIKIEQENWIGKSTGAYVDFNVKDTDEVLKVYTTRPDTLYGATFMVIAPEHQLLVRKEAQINNMDAIQAYQEEARRKTEFERVELQKDNYILL